MKLNVCVFSGGFDSALVLARTFWRIEAGEHERDERLLIVSVIPNYSGKKTNREEVARKNIIEYLSSKYRKVSYELSTIRINYSDRVCSLKKYRKLTQPITWLDGLMSSDMFNYDNLDTVTFNMSYNKEDQALIYRQEIENIIQSSFNIMWMDRYKPSIQVLYPIAHRLKADILEELIDDYPDVYNYATTCENAYHDADDCGMCHPCNELKWALAKISISGKYDSIREFAKKELERRFHQSISMTPCNNDESATYMESNVKDLLDNMENDKLDSSNWLKRTVDNNKEVEND